MLREPRVKAGWGRSLGSSEVLSNKRGADRRSGECYREDFNALRDVGRGKEWRVRSPLVENSASPTEEVVSQRRKPTTDHHLVDICRQHEKSYRCRDTPEETLACVHGARFACSRTGEEIAGGVVMLGRPHSCNGKPRSERLEASTLPTRTDDPGRVDRDMSNLSSDAVSAAQQSAVEHDAGGEPGSEIQVGH